MSKSKDEKDEREDTAPETEEQGEPADTSDEESEQPGEAPAEQEQPEAESDSSDEEQPDEDTADGQPEGEGTEQDEQPEPAGQGSDSTEIEQLRRELTEARAVAEAAKLGIRADVLDDAVCLAARAAGEKGDIRKALSDVLKKYPDWKSGGTDDKQGGGFKVGAPSPDERPAPAKTQNTAPQKRWNRFN